MRLFSQEQRGIYINLRQNWQCLRGYSPGRQFWRHFVYIWLLKQNKLCLFDFVLAERALDVTLSAQKRRARVPNDLKSGVETPSSGSRADWSRFGVVQVDLFASPETAHCQWFYSLSKSRSARMHWHTAGPRACANMHSPSEPTCTNTVQNQGGWGEVLSEAPYWPSRTRYQELMLLATDPPWPIPLRKDTLSQRRGTLWHPRPEWDAEVLCDLSQEVALTIPSPWAPSTRRTYALKWNLFVEWCSSPSEDPRRCSIRAVLSSLQQRLERRLPPPPLKVYMAAIPPTTTP